MKKLTATRRQVFLGVGATALMPLRAEAATNAGAKAVLVPTWQLGDDIEKFMPGMRAKLKTRQRWFTVEEVAVGWEKEKADIRAYWAWRRGGGAP